MDWLRYNIIGLSLQQIFIFLNSLQINPVFIEIPSSDFLVIFGNMNSFTSIFKGFWCFSAQMKDSFSALTCLRGGRFSVIHKYVTSEKLLKGNSFTDIFHGFCLLCRENSLEEHRLITASCLYLCIIKYLFILNMM